MSAIPPVIIRAKARHTATLIFLHGLGDTGFGWAGALNTIRPPYMKVICPTAPSIPVTLNGGMVMPAWYDILSLSDKSNKRENMEEVEAAAQNLLGIVDSEVNNESILRNRVIIGGFSQGGAVALHAMLTAKEPLGGCLALSAYIPGNQTHEAEEKKDTPVLQIHGEMDDVVTFDRGQKSADVVQKLVKKHSFKAMPYLGHEASPEEMEYVKEFINTHVPDINN